MSFDIGLGEFSRPSSEIRSLDIFVTKISCPELTANFYAIINTKYQCVIAHLCLDENHQGVSISHKNTHHQDICAWRLDSMWCGPGMVFHMMSKMAHEFVDDDKNPWSETSNGLYFV